MPQVPSSQIQLWSVRSWRGISTYQRGTVSEMGYSQSNYNFPSDLTLVDSSTWDEREEKKQMRQWF